MCKGFVKIYRSSMDDNLYFAEPFTKWQAWIDLIMLAYISDSVLYVRGIKVDTKRGCVYVGTEELAKRWKWSRGKVLRFLMYLETEQQIEQQKSNVINCISIVNFDKYQSLGTPNDTTDSTTEKKKEPKKKREEENNTPLIIPPKGGTKKKAKFVVPSVVDIAAYIYEKGYDLDAQTIFDYYEANGWVQGRQGKPIKDWKAVVRTWNNNKKNYGATNRFTTKPSHADYVAEAQDRLLRNIPRPNVTTAEE